VVHQRTASLDTERDTGEGSEVHEGRLQTISREVYATGGKARLISRP